ncbi:MAG: hypothetical protein QXU52_02925 [Fervidicoccaceae archaeon]
MRLIRRDALGSAALAAAVLCASYVLHSPRALAHYSDVVSLYYTIYSSPERWFEGRQLNPGVPYFDYHFEYPPLVGLSWWLSTLAAEAWGGEDLWSKVGVHFDINAALSSLFYALYVIAALSFYRLIAADPLALGLALASPSMIYYLFYNWDIQATALATWSALLLLRGSELRSSLSLSFSALAKLLPLTALPGLLVDAYRRGGARAAARALHILSPLALVGLVALILCPRGLETFLEHHAHWYCENCFYVLAIGDLWDPMWRRASVILSIGVAGALGVYLASSLDERDARTPISLYFLPVAAFISLSYVYSPQMNILFSPLFLVLPRPLLYVALAQDALNASIMLLWPYNDSFCERWGVGCNGPWTRESPIQWVAFARIALLWVVVALASRALHRSARNA